jgi:hypothetical protein
VPLVGKSSQLMVGGPADPDRCRVGHGHILVAVDFSVYSLRFAAARGIPLQRIGQRINGCKPR